MWRLRDLLERRLSEGTVSGIAKVCEDRHWTCLVTGLTGRSKDIGLTGLGLRWGFENGNSMDELELTLKPLGSIPLSLPDTVLEKGSNQFIWPWLDPFNTF